MSKMQIENKEDYSKSFTCADAKNDESSIQINIDASNQKNKKMSDLCNPSPTKDETYTQSAATLENCIDTSNTIRNEIEPCTGSEQQSSEMEFQASGEA